MGSWDREAACADFACAWCFSFLQTRKEDARPCGVPYAQVVEDETRRAKRANLANGQCITLTFS